MADRLFRWLCFADDARPCGSSTALAPVGGDPRIDPPTSSVSLRLPASPQGEAFDRQNPLV